MHVRSSFSDGRPTIKRSRIDVQLMRASTTQPITGGFDRDGGSERLSLEGTQRKVALMPCEARKSQMAPMMTCTSGDLVLPFSTQARDAVLSMKKRTDCP